MGDAFGLQATGLPCIRTCKHREPAVYPKLVTYTATGEVQTVRYHELIPLLLAELQRQEQELKALRALVEDNPVVRRKAPRGRTATTTAR